MEKKDKKENQYERVLWRFIEELLVHISNYNKKEETTWHQTTKLLEENDLDIESLSIKLSRSKSGKSSPKLRGYKGKSEKKRDELARKFQSIGDEANYNAMALFMISVSAFERHMNDLIWVQYVHIDETRVRMNSDFKEKKVIGKLDADLSHEELSPKLRNYLREITIGKNIFKLADKFFCMEKRGDWVFNYKNKKKYQYQLSEIIYRRNLLIHRKLEYDLDYVKDMTDALLEQYKDFDDQFLKSMFDHYKLNKLFAHSDIKKLEDLVNIKSEIDTKYLTHCVDTYLTIFIRFWTHGYNDHLKNSGVDQTDYKVQIQVSKVLNRLMDLSEELIGNYGQIGLQEAIYINWCSRKIWEQSYLDFTMGIAIQELKKQKEKLRKAIPDESEDEFKEKLLEIKKRTTYPKLNEFPLIFLIDYLLLKYHQQTYSKMVKNLKKDSENWSNSIQPSEIKDKRALKIINFLEEKEHKEPLVKIYFALYMLDDYTNEEIIKLIEQWDIPEDINAENLFLLRELRNHPKFKNAIRKGLRLVKH